MSAIGRFAIAGIPAGLAGWGAFVLLGGTSGWMMVDKIQGAVGTAIIGLVVVVVYVAILAVMRAPELKAGTALVRRFFPGR